MQSFLLLWRQSEIFVKSILVCFVQEQGSQAVHEPVGSGADGDEDLLFIRRLVVGCAVLLSLAKLNRKTHDFDPCKKLPSTGRISGTKCLWHQRLKRARRGRFCGNPAPNPLIDLEHAPPRPYDMRYFLAAAGQKHMFFLYYTNYGFSRYLRGCWIFTSLSPVKYCASSSVSQAFRVDDSVVSCWVGLWMCGTSSPFQRHLLRRSWYQPWTFNRWFSSHGNHLGWEGNLRIDRIHQSTVFVDVSQGFPGSWDAKKGSHFNQWCRYLDSCLNWRGVGIPRLYIPLWQWVRGAFLFSLDIWYMISAAQLTLSILTQREGFTIWL